MKRWSTTLLLVGWTPGLAFAAPADGVQKLMDLGKLETAQAKCERTGATYSTADQDLREICAEAYYEKAKEKNSVGSWIRFQQTWGGTTWMGPAREMEGAAALRELGEAAEEHAYQSYMDRYGDTKYALQAEQMMMEAAIRGVDNSKDAVRVARKYPNHRLTPSLVEKYLTSFIRMDLNGSDITVSLEPAISVPGKAPQGKWVASYSEDVFVDWNQNAEGHLKDIGASQMFVDRAKGNSTGQVFQPCQIPEAEWKLGILVEVGETRQFFPNAGVESCKRRPWPAFTIHRNGTLDTLSLGPELTLRFPTDPAAQWFGWGPTDVDTRMFIPAPAGKPILVGTVIGQPVGRLFLLHPLAGGMPWYVAQPPPAEALELPTDLKSTAIPLGWSIRSDEGPMGPGESSEGTITITGEPLGGSIWTLPPGEIRVMSPLVQEITKLNRSNVSLLRERMKPVPPLTGRAGPMGSTPVPFAEVPNIDQVTKDLRSFGMAVKVTRAWQGFVGSDGPQEVIFEGTIGGVAAKGLLDPFEGGGGFRLFIWYKDARSQAEDEEMLAFKHSGAAYVAWLGKSAEGDNYVEAIHFEKVGLVREFR